jgi:hypothetical protein
MKSTGAFLHLFFGGRSYSLWSYPGTSLLAIILIALTCGGISPRLEMGVALC